MHRMTADMGRLIVLAALLTALVPATARADFSFDRTDFEVPTGAALYDVAIADLGGAFGPDIVASANALNKLELLRNIGGGAFAPPAERAACSNGDASPTQIVAGQFDSGPAGDVAVACGFVTVVPGSAGDLGAPQSTGAPTRGIVAAGELDGGGTTELIFGGPAGSNKAVLCFMIRPFSGASAICGNDPMEPQPPLLPDPIQGFWVGTPTPVVADLVGPASPRHDEVFGLNTDGLHDEITIYNRAPIAGPGPLFQSWNAVTRKTSTDRPYFIDVGDIEGDGDMDILVGHKGGGHFDLFVNGTSGIPPGAVPTLTPTLGFENQAGRLADFDRDGRADAAIVGGQGVLAVHKGNGDGTFGPAQEIAIAGANSAVALDVGDLDGDLDPDIVVVERHVPAAPQRFTVLINRSLPPVTSPPPGTPGGPPAPGGSPPSPAGPLPSPLTGLKGLKSTLVVGRTGKATLGTATNPPTAATSQTLVASGAAAARRTTLARGRTAIPAGTTKRIVVKLSAKALRRLRRARSLRVTLTIQATGPTGSKAALRKSVRLKRPR
jgi:hypothetical protein